MENLKYISSSLNRRNTSGKKDKKNILMRYKSLSANEVLEENEDFSIKFVLKYNIDDTFAIDIVENHFDQEIRKAGGRGPDEGLEQVKAFLERNPGLVREYLNRIDE